MILRALKKMRTFITSIRSQDRYELNHKDPSMVLSPGIDQ